MTHFVEAGQSCDRIRVLMACGMTRTEIALASGLRKETIREISNHMREFTSVENAEAILSVHVPITHEVRSMAWVEKASCRGHDPRWWDGESKEDALKAIAICDVCPGRKECLEDDLRVPPYDGRRYNIRGGITGFKRDKMVRAKKAESAA